MPRWTSPSRCWRRCRRTTRRREPPRAATDRMAPAGYTLAELAERCGGEVRGDGGTRVSAVATLQNGRPGAISFLANPHYRRYLADTRSTAVILAPADVEDCKVPALISKNPYLLYAKVAALLAPESPVQGGVHPAASVDPAARVDAGAWIGPGAVVEAGAEVG